MADAPNSFMLWLDEALSGWILPVVGLVAVLAVGGLYLLDVASEEVTASVVVLAVSIGIALYLLRPALDAKRDGGSRILAAAAAFLTLAAAAVPALTTVHPGRALFEGEMGQPDATVSIPPGTSGAVRVLVSGKLPEYGEPSVSYTISGTQDPVEGKLERTYNSVRVGRGGRARVAHDRNANMYAARILPGAQTLKLERLQGQSETGLHVAVYREPIPVVGGPWLLALLAVVAAAIAEARLGQKNDLAVASGMAVAFGLLVTYNATPQAAIGPTVGGIILGAICGSLGGWILGALIRRFVPAAKKRQAPRLNGAAAA